MKIKYKETTNDLMKRIEIHQKCGSRDIDQWMLNLLNLKENINILDIGCGSGKQCFIFYDYLKGKCNIIGGDISEDLLSKAKSENEKIGNKIKFIKLDFNKELPFQQNQFDFVSCCFAIYYAEDIPYTVSEMFRVLKPGGRLFTTGPMPENKKVFYDIIKQATGKPIPLMPGSSRYSSKILSEIKKRFKQVDVHIFENPLVFKEAEPFISYTKASLSEDRKLWSDIQDFDQCINKITEITKEIIDNEGQLVMTKVVGGFIAYK